MDTIIVSGGFDPGYHLNKLSLLERFWIQIDRKDDDECWNWLGLLRDKRYGVMDINRKTIPVSHVSLLILNGVDVPSGMIACHTCDNTKCANPNHIFLGTQEDNMQDMVRKGRKKTIWREQSKLSIDDVREIRKLKETGLSHLKIGQLFNVNQSAITRIVNYHSYLDVDPHLFKQSLKVRTVKRNRKKYV